MRNYFSSLLFVPFVISSSLYMIVKFGAIPISVGIVPVRLFEYKSLQRKEARTKKEEKERKKGRNECKDIRPTFIFCRKLLT
jgi:hypothetical protein